MNPNLNPNHMKDTWIYHMLFQWCSAWSCGIRDFKSQSFTAGKQWLEEDTCATIEIVKSCNDKEFQSWGQEYLKEN